MHKWLAGMEKIDYVIAAGGRRRDGRIKHRNPWDGGPVAGAGAALNKEACPQLTQCVFDRLCSAMADKVR